MIYSHGKFIGAVIILLIALGAYFVLSDAVNQNGTQLGLIEGEIQLQTQTANQLASFKTVLNSVSGDEAAINNYFVSDAQVVPFINGLQQQGTVLGSTVTINAVDSTASDHLTFTLSIAGTFPAVMRTIGSIEYAPYDISVSNLSLVQSGKGAWAGTMTISVGSAPDIATSTQGV